MSNFFSALGSDDDEPKTRVQAGKDSGKSKGEAPSANAAVKETDRLTGAAKKNKDQQRHGAKPRNAKKADAPVTEVSDGKKPKREFDRNSSDPKTKKVSNSTVAGGSVQQDAADAAKNPAAFLASESAKDDAEDDAAPAEPAVQVPAVITADEFFAQRAAKAASLASLVAPKKERKVETKSTLGAKKQEEDLLEGSALRNLSVTGPSKRLAGKQVLDIKFNIKSDLVEEERPERAPREGGDRAPRAPREGGDRPPRAPREGGDRPPRAPREGGDRAPRAPREGGDRPRTGKPNTDRQGAKPEGERRPRPQTASAARGVDFADAAAFPKL